MQPNVLAWRRPQALVATRPKGVLVRPGRSAKLSQIELPAAVFGYKFFEPGYDNRVVYSHMSLQKFS